MSATAAVRLSCLGTEEAVRDGMPLRLRPRQLEILTLLALEPDGMSPERLRDALYGDRPVTASTFKAEVSHLHGGRAAALPRSAAAALGSAGHRRVARASGGRGT